MAEEHKKKAKKLTAYERWELPNLKDPQEKARPGVAVLLQNEASMVSEEVDQDSLVYEPLTASQLEEIRSAAYDEGFAQGHEEGKESGFHEGKSEGYQKGYEEGQLLGKEEGHKQGSEEAHILSKAQLEQVETYLAALLKDLQQPLSVTRNSVEDLVLTTVQRLVENITQSQLAESATDLLASQLQTALDKAEEFEGKIRVSIHPDDYMMLEQQGVIARLDVKFEQDESLQQGGFIVDSKGFYIDGSIESRMQLLWDELEQLRSQLLSAEPHDLPSS